MAKKEDKPEIDTECAICGTEGNYKADLFSMCKKCGREVCEVCIGNNGLCKECEED